MLTNTLRRPVEVMRYNPAYFAPNAGPSDEYKERMCDDWRRHTRNRFGPYMYKSHDQRDVIMCHTGAYTLEAGASGLMAVPLSGDPDFRSAREQTEYMLLRRELRSLNFFRLVRGLYVVALILTVIITYTLWVVDAKTGLPFHLQQTKFVMLAATVVAAMVLSWLVIAVRTMVRNNAALRNMPRDPHDLALSFLHYV